MSCVWSCSGLVLPAQGSPNRGPGVAGGRGPTSNPGRAAAIRSISSTWSGTFHPTPSWASRASPACSPRRSSGPRPRQSIDRSCFRCRTRPPVPRRSPQMSWRGPRVALVGSGSPFEPVLLAGATYTITQVNNLYIFPGVGLGVVAVAARAVSYGMLTAAATAIGEMVSMDQPDDGALLPPISASRDVGLHVARAVAHAAIEEGLAPEVSDEDVGERFACLWCPSTT